MIEALEHFDDEGSGSIASESLKPLLKRLLVPVTKEQLVYLQGKLDPDRSGALDSSPCSADSDSDSDSLPQDTSTWPSSWTGTARRMRTTSWSLSRRERCCGRAGCG